MVRDQHEQQPSPENAHACLRWTEHRAQVWSQREVGLASGSSAVRSAMPPPCSLAAASGASQMWAGRLRSVRDPSLLL